MAVVDRRSKVLFLPVVRGRAYNLDLTKRAKSALRDACKDLGIDGIFPADDKYTEGLIAETGEAAQFYQVWRGDMSDIKALIAFSGDFMRERAIQDTMRLLPADVPAFLMVGNDDPTDMGTGKVGDALCGSLSVHHNARMLGRPLVRSCRIDMSDRDLVREFLGRYQRIIDGIEVMRNMRVAMLGLNPESFATTFSNQLKLIELGFSLHTYELITMWGDTVLGGLVQDGETTCQGPFGEVGLWRPIGRGDERVDQVKEKLNELFDELPEEQKVDRIARAYLWISDVFGQDGIDAGAIHCWSEFPRFFGFAPCTIAMLANLLQGKPVVCEGDIGHAIMARLAWEMTGEAGVILDINNNGWDPRVFNVFHCSQTPTNWLCGRTCVGGWGRTEGAIRPEPFTAISAATTSDDFKATVFQGQFLRRQPEMRGSSGWAFVPNLQDVLKAVEAAGIHHFVAMKGHYADQVAGALEFRGLNVTQLAEDLPDLDTIEADLPDPDEGEMPGRKVFSE